MFGKQALLYLGTALLCVSANCQMVVHAVSGTVKSFNPKPMSMSVVVESGSIIQFAIRPDSKVALSFEDDLRGDAVDASKFNKVGAFVMVYYYGFETRRTAVAVKDLGPDPFKKTEGTVVDFNKHDRVLTVRDSKGTNETFRLSDNAVVDTGMGLQSGRKYEPDKGYKVRVTSSSADGKDVAVFIRSRQT